MLLFYIYIAGVVILHIIGLIRNIEITFRGIFIVIYFWPLFLPFMLFTMIGWNFHCIKSANRFGFRKPNDNWPGFAITAFNYEFQFWKQR